MQNTHRKTPIPMHARESTTPSTGASAADVARDLAGPLTALIERYESFVKTLETHRAAISKADARAIDDAIAREGELLEELLRLDAACRDALGQNDPDPSAASGWTLTRLAQANGGEDGQRLSEASAYLKALTSRAEILQRSVREASAAMASHIDGLVRQVAQRLSHAGTYGAGGRVEVKAPVVSGLDVRL